MGYFGHAMLLDPGDMSLRGTVQNLHSLSPSFLLLYSLTFHTASRLPMGKWGGRIGKLLAQDMLAGWPSMRPLAHGLLGVTPETFNEVMGKLEGEWNSYHTSYEVYFVCGQV
ncbi:MAG: hypothetical protein JO202_19155 [Ktedonobacteraceae bacterium]|nr:hypothetical protein [Ktedonobacteraceae bacterium]